MADAGFALSDAQVNYFRTFGYVVLRGLFAEDMPRITEGFETAYSDAEADPTKGLLPIDAALHDGQPRINLLDIATSGPGLSWLLDDARVMTIAETLVIGDAEPAGSDGSLFWCDTNWHSDTFGAPLGQHHVKLSWYLDELTASTGAIRVLPGTHHLMSGYGRQLREITSREDASYVDELGVEPSELPSVPIETVPGDLVCWDYRTIHASYGGMDRRRLLSISFRDGSFDVEAHRLKMKAALDRRSAGAGS